MRKCEKHQVTLTAIGTCPICWGEDEGSPIDK